MLTGLFYNLSRLISLYIAAFYFAFVKGLGGDING